MILRTTTFALALALWAPEALAQGEDVEALIRRGVELRREGNDDAAFEQFARAYGLAPSGRTAAQLASAEQALGRWVDAVRHFEEALARSTEPWVAEHRAGIEQALSIARQHVGLLELRGEAPGATVLIDGAVAGTMPLAAPLVVPAGTIELRIRMEGRVDAVRPVTIAAGGRAREEVAFGPPVTAAAAGSPAETVSAPRVVRPAVPRAHAETTVDPGTGTTGADDGLIAAGVVLLSLGALSFGAAAVNAAFRESNVAEFNSDRCLDMPDVTRGEQCADLLRSVSNWEIGIVTGLIAGPVFAIVGAILVGLGASAGGGDSAALACGAGPGSGLTCGGSF